MEGRRRKGRKEGRDIEGETEGKRRKKGSRRNFVSRKFRETCYETIFVFRENEGRVPQFRETAEITKETRFAKHLNRENKENLK
jgi:hypothetical protein